MSKDVGSRRRYSLASGAVAMQIIAIVLSTVTRFFLRLLATWSPDWYWLLYTGFVLASAACLIGFWLALRGWKQAKFMAAVAVILGVAILVENAGTFGL